MPQAYADGVPDYEAGIRLALLQVCQASASMER